MQRLSKRSLCAAALVLLDFTSAVALGRIFDNNTYLVPILLASVPIHLVGLVGAARSWSWWTTVVAIVATQTIVVLHLLPDAQGLVIPSPSRFSQAGHEIAISLRDASVLDAPIAPAAPYVFSVCVLMALFALASEVLAWRKYADVDAVVPSFIVLCATSVVGDGSEIGDASIWLASAIAFVVFKRRSKIPTLARPRGAARFLADSRLWAPLIAAVVIAFVATPGFPGYGTGSLLADRSNKPQRSTINPFVDIRGQEVKQSDTVMFKVRSDRRAYWRITALEDFDGEVWSGRGSYKDVNRELQTAPKGTETFTAEFEIEGLASEWLPAPFFPVEVESAIPVAFDTRSDSILGPAATVSGQRYDVTAVISPSGVPRLDPPPRPSYLSEDLKLPKLDPRVRALTQSVTANSGTPHDKARALQDYLRTFTYDLNVAPGHSEAALTQFLFETKRGYCEQFAGSYAVMARTIGLPSRVAIGFTPGESRQEGIFEVRGLHAHAWPEVYLDGLGWVAFEPTPGRGMPGAEAFTGVPEAQASSVRPQTATTLQDNPGLTTSSQPAPTQVPTTKPGAASTTPQSRHANGIIRLSVLLSVGVIAAIAAATTIAVRRRRSARAQGVQAAWRRCERLLTKRHAPRKPAETISGYTRRIAEQDDMLKEAMRSLNSAAVHAFYGVDSSTTPSARANADLDNAVREIERLIAEENAQRSSRR